MNAPFEVVFDQPPNIDIPEYVMRLTRAFRPLVLRWRRYAARKAERKHLVLEPKVMKCKTRAEVDRLLGKPLHILNCGYGEISAEGCRWLSNDQTLGSAFDCVGKVSEQEFQERFGQSVTQFFDLANQRTAELGLGVRPERTAVYCAKGCEFWVGLVGDRVVRIASHQARSYWDYAMMY